jgi:RimJ/RimL family protein N-acetyltransferase
MKGVTLMFEAIETARVRLRRFQDGDLAAFLAYRNDPDVARYQSWDTITEEEARAFIAEMQTLEPGQPGWPFQFAVALRATDALIGDIMLLRQDDDDRLGEIGYSFAPEYQGQGFATEAVRAVLAYAFDTLGLHRVHAVADCRNLASVRLMERVGMRREGHFVQHLWFKGAWCDEYLYAMLREEWVAR